jgi:sugar fermentation stimulation protein A
MQSSPTLFLGSFVRRYKRFFTDIIDEKGNLLTVHCPNTGSMKNCQVEGSECWYSLSDNPKRKLQGTLEIVTTSHGQLAGINTLNANRLVANALECKIIPELASYDTVSKEVRYGSEKAVLIFFSRIVLTIYPIVMLR